MASIITTSHIHQPWLNTDNCFKLYWNREKSHEHTHRSLHKENKASQLLQKVLPDPWGERGRCAEVFTSWCYSSIPCLPSATGVTPALIKMRPDFEHKAAAQGILALPAQLCFTLLLEEADGSEVHVVPIFEATKEPQSPAQALGSSSDARGHRGLQPCHVKPQVPPFPTTPPGRLVQRPLPSIPSNKPTLGFYVFYSQSITPGLAGSPWGLAPMQPLTQGHSHPIDHHERSLFLFTVDLQAPRVFCKPQTWQDPSFGAGQSPTTAESSRRQRGDGAFSQLTRHQFAPCKTRTTWGNQESSRAGWMPGVRGAAPSWGCRSSAGWCPWAEQGHLRLILTDRKYVLKTKCPDRLRLCRSPRHCLQSRDSGGSSSAVRSSYGDNGFGLGVAGQQG